MRKMLHQNEIILNIPRLTTKKQGTSASKKLHALLLYQTPCHPLMTMNFRRYPLTKLGLIKMIDDVLNLSVTQTGAE